MTRPGRRRATRPGRMRCVGHRPADNERPRREGRMRPRSIVIALAAAALAGCTSPGKPVENRDLKFFAGAASTPRQPAIGQDVTVDLTLFNVDRRRGFDGVAWTAYLDPPDPLVPTGGTPIPDTIGRTASLPANSILPQSFLLAAQSAGDHTVAIVIDPASAIAESDETNNVFSFTIAWADLDIAFAVEPALVSRHLDPSNNVTVQFSIENIPTAGGTAPAANVSWEILDNGVSVATSGGSPVAVASGATVPVQVPIPSTAGSHAFSVILTTPGVAQGDSGNDESEFVVGVDTGA
jgi:hypothetical protein